MRGVGAERPPIGATTPLDDARSLHLLGTIDTAEIGLARLALSLSRNADVRRFAREVKSGHENAQQRIHAWASEQRTAPAATPVSREVERHARALYQRLQTADDFDRAYVESQVAMHEDALQLIDERIATGVTDRALRALVQGFRGDVARRRDMARALDVRVL